MRAHYLGTVPAASRLRVNAHGPVTLEGGVAKDLSYTIRLSVNARTEAEARRASAAVRSAHSERRAPGRC